MSKKLTIRAASDLYSLSDAVVFVSSQEKYADEVLHDFFMKVVQDEKPTFFVLNKASSEATREEILKALQNQGLHIHGANLWLIPHTTPGVYDRIAGLKSFIRMRDAFLQTFTREQAQHIRSAAASRETRALKKDLKSLQSLLALENQAVDEWLKKTSGTHTPFITGICSKPEGTVFKNQRTIPEGGNSEAFLPIRSSGQTPAGHPQGF